ncbi:MAG: hypothetical protein QM662_14070 [Gordonia sp. (in: high G+C Gram-positive bacteria)]
MSVLLLGLAAIAVGGGALAVQAGLAPIDDWNRRLDLDAVLRFVDGPWWPAVTGGVVIVGLAWGLRLLGAATRPTAPGKLRTADPDARGSLTVAPKLIAAAAAEELSGQAIVESVAGSALDDRGDTIIRLTVTAGADNSYDEILEIVEKATETVRESVAGTDVHVQAFVHIKR